MAKSKGFPSIFCLVLMVFLQSNSCTSCSGVPSDFNSVVLNATALKISAGQMVTITASVPKDTTGAGVSWVFTPGAGAPVPPGVFTATSVTSSTYAAPTTAIAAEFTVTIQATSLSTAFPPETNSIIITIGQTQPLKITTTTLPNGVLGTAYPAGTQLQATGGVPPYTWALTTAASTFPTNLALNPNGTITGTPTATGVFNTFTVKVSDSEPTPMTASTTAGQLSITITNLLNGNYAFEFSGFNSSGAVVVAGHFNADGVSKITGGVEDFNSITQSSYKNQTFTGTFTLLNTNRGQLVFTTLPGSPTYDFALDSMGLHGRMVEFDATGVRGSGELAQQNTATCGSQTMSGAGPLGADFVIGLSGAEGNFTGTTPGPFALAGRFTAEVPASSSTPGAIDTGEVDANAPGNVIVGSPNLSGTFQTSAQAARCMMSVTQTLGNMNFSVYPITTTSGLLTEAFIVETDSVSQATPFVSIGRLIHQTGYPFAQAIQSFPATSASVGGLSGAVIPIGGTTYVPLAAVAQLQANGGNGFTLSLMENIAGTVGSALGVTAITASFVTGDSFGRVDTNLASPTIVPVFYVINNKEALCILENLSAPVLGIFEPQSKGGGATFSTSTITGTLVQGTSQPATTALQNYSGVITFTTGAVAGTEDLSTTASNSSGLAISGTYALTASGVTDGSGTFNLTQAPPPPAFNGEFFIVSPTKAVMITTTAGDTNPVLTILGEQTDDFGVN
jgi:hypothetical protein